MSNGRVLRNDENLPGYLDDVVATFERHGHPFVLVGTFGLTWCSTALIPCSWVDLLLTDDKMEAIAADLERSGRWFRTENPAYSKRFFFIKDYNTSDVADIWLESSIADRMGPLWIRHLRLLPEALYQLSVRAGQRFEVPDLYSPQHSICEPEYLRDPLRRFGPPVLTSATMPGPREVMPIQCRVATKHVPIYIPSIQDHLNALLDQCRVEEVTGTCCGLEPQLQIDCLIRYLFIDWPPARDWLLENKIEERNRARMEGLLLRYKRKTVLQLGDGTAEPYRCLPWDRPMPPNTGRAQEPPDTDGYKIETD